MRLNRVDTCPVVALGRSPHRETNPLKTCPAQLALLREAIQSGAALGAAARGHYVTVGRLERACRSARDRDGIKAWAHPLQPDVAVLVKPAG